MKSVLIVVEGPDFSGKSTAATTIESELLKLGLPVTRNTVKSSPVRSVSKFVARLKFAPPVIADTLFFVAVLIDELKIRLLLRRGVSVVQDRYYPSYFQHLLAASTVGRRKHSPFITLYRYWRHVCLDPNLIIYCQCVSATLEQRYRESLRQRAFVPSLNDVWLFEGDTRPVKLLRDHFSRALEGFSNVVEISNEGSLVEFQSQVRLSCHHLVAEWGLGNSSPAGP